MVVPADQRFTHWGSTPLLLLMGNVVYYVMGPSDRHIITSMSELYHMERAFQSNNKLCGGIQSPIRPSCTGPDPAIGLPMASLTYWTKLIDSSNRRVFFLRGPETQHGVLTSLGEYKNDKNKSARIIV